MTKVVVFSHGSPFRHKLIAEAARILPRFQIESLGNIVRARLVFSPHSMPTLPSKKSWLATHSEIKAAERLRYYRQFQKNDKRKGKRWTEAEDRKIMAKRKLPDSKLSKFLGRSVQAIQQRRWELRSNLK